MSIAEADSIDLVRLARLDSGDTIVVRADQGRVLLGRTNDAEVRVVHPNVSRRQAMLTVRDDGLLVEHIEGAAEMRLNGDVIVASSLARDGDVLSIGTCQLRIGHWGAARASKSPVVNDLRDDLVTMLGASAPGDVELPWSSIAVSHGMRIGRDPFAVEAVLPHPLVSRTHAMLQRSADGYSIEDLGSANGTYVNGVRVGAPQLLLAGDEIACGPYTLLFTGTELSASTRRRRGSIEAIGLWKGVPAKEGTRWLLRDVNLSVHAGEFVAVIGPSGCGKSTLLRTLAGRSSFAAGSIHLGGYSVSTELDTVKRTVAVVPQRETLFDALTVRQMLACTGELRLPADTSRAERQRLVESVLQEVGLLSLADQRIETLSGGQRRRAVLANEVLSGPSLVFLDEVTSGLDEGSDLEIMRLLRQLANSGRAIVCVTHTVANLVDLCDRVVVMARGGVVMSDEAPARTLKRFGIARFAELYVRLAEGAEVTASPPSGRARIAPNGRAVSGDATRQLGIVVAREVQLIAAKPALLALSLGQSVIIGCALRLAFGGPPFAPPQWLSLLFFLGMCCFWFGCNNASKEIVKQRDILLAEFAVNLQLRSFVWAKVLVQSVIAMAQVLILLGTLRALGVAWPAAWTLVGFLASAIAGVCLGLAISGASDSVDQAATLVPISIIPQLLLSGIVTVYPTAFVETIAKIFVSGHWMGDVAAAAATQESSRSARDAAVLLLHAGVFVAGLSALLRQRLVQALRR